MSFGTSRARLSLPDPAARAASPPPSAKASATTTVLFAKGAVDAGRIRRRKVGISFFFLVLLCSFIIAFFHSSFVSAPLTGAKDCHRWNVPMTWSARGNPRPNHIRSHLRGCESPMGNWFHENIAWNFSILEGWQLSSLFVGIFFRTRFSAFLNPLVIQPALPQTNTSAPHPQAARAEREEPHDVRWSHAARFSSERWALVLIVPRHRISTEQLATRFRPPDPG